MAASTTEAGTGAPAANDRIPPLATDPAALRRMTGVRPLATCSAAAQQTTGRRCLRDPPVGFDAQRRPSDRLSLEGDRRHHGPQAVALWLATAKVIAVPLFGPLGNVCQGRSVQDKDVARILRRRAQGRVAGRRPVSRRESTGRPEYGRHAEVLRASSGHDRSWPAGRYPLAPSEEELASMDRAEGKTAPSLDQLELRQPFDVLLDLPERVEQAPNLVVPVGGGAGQHSDHLG
jgi:hypothetical protein